MEACVNFLWRDVVIVVYVYKLTFFRCIGFMRLVNWNFIMLCR